MHSDSLAGISPIFITGVWRSGTTLISRILNNHKDLNITYDTVHFLRFSLDNYDPISNIKNIERLVEDTAGRLRKRYSLDISVKDILSNLDGVFTYSSVYNSIMINFLLKNNDFKIWGEKTNLAWTKIPAFINMFPNARIIHMIRDPRAVLSSWKKFTHAPGNDYLDSILNCHNSMSMALDYKNRFENNRYIYLTYEELVSMPKETMEKVCQKLDLNFEENMLNHLDFTDRQGEPWHANTVYDENIKGISTAMIDKWKCKLEEWEIALTDKIIGNLNHEFNYKSTALANNEKLIESAIEKILLSNLASEGILRYLLTGKGFERYPSNPLNEKNWTKSANQKS